MNENIPRGNHFVTFNDYKIRWTFENYTSWFVIVDVIAALTGSKNPSGYLKDMKRRDPELIKGWGQIATPLSINTGGGLQKLNCANTDGILQIIQSLPSDKVNPFKRWLAKIRKVPKKLKSSKVCDFTEKTRTFTHSVGDPFFGQFFNEEDINQIIKHVFNESTKINRGNLFELLNNIVHFLGTFYPDINKLTPGKTDELSLIDKIEHHTSGLLKYLDILLSQYDYETLKYIKLYAPWAKEINTRLSLHGIFEACQMLDGALPIAKQGIESKAGKKTGNNSMQAIPGLIYHLIFVYKEITGKSADKNFHQDKSTGRLKYKGQFFDFVHHVLFIINGRFKKRYPDKKEDNPFNPFKICLEEESIALGQHIYRTISNLKKKPKAAPTHPNDSEEVDMTNNGISFDLLAQTIPPEDML
jgi:hypothetical protein